MYCLPSFYMADMLTVSLDCPFLISSTVFSNVYLLSILVRDLHRDGHSSCYNRESKEVTIQPTEGL